MCRRRMNHAEHELRRSSSRLALRRVVPLFLVAKFRLAYQKGDLDAGVEMHVSVPVGGLAGDV